MRFVPITEDVFIQYWLEFIGESAKKVRGIEAELRLCIADAHYESERVIGDKSLQATTRLYLNANFESVFAAEPNDVIFFRSELDELLNSAGVREDFCKLQLRRENGARIVCFRPGDENPALTGFGRTKPGATRSSHQDFSETYVDRKPGMEFTNYKGEKQIWDGFRPLYLKVQPADDREEYYLRIDVDWDDGRINILVYQNVDVPPELVAYQFSPRGGGIAVDLYQEKKNAEALEELFVRTRRPSVNDGRPGSSKMDKAPHR